MPTFKALLQSAYWWLRYQFVQDDRSHWNYQYACGRWEKLKAPAEHARLDACAQLLRRYAHNGHVLELGCGEALLQRRLSSDEYFTWHGVDISEISIHHAQALACDRVAYRTGDITTLEPTEKYDAIIFSESLPYVSDRDKVLQRYRQWLTPRGIFIISIFDTPGSPAIWQEIHLAALTLETIKSDSALGSWTCEVLKPNAIPVASSAPMQAGSLTFDSSRATASFD